MSYTTKIIKQKLKTPGQLFVSPPLTYKPGTSAPETTKKTLARLMLASGAISREDYEKMLGVSYDLDVSDDSQEDFDFEDDSVTFQQSSFAQYEDFLEVSREEAETPSPAETAETNVEVLSDEQTTTESSDTQ